MFLSFFFITKNICVFCVTVGVGDLHTRGVIWASALATLK